MQIPKDILDYPLREVLVYGTSGVNIVIKVEIPFAVKEKGSNQIENPQTTNV